MIKFIANTLWLIFGGLFDAIIWTFYGILFSITIIGLPIGMQCFKLAKLHFWPFGKKIVYAPTNASILLNIFWIIIGGVPIAIAEVTSGLILCAIIIGIPFGIQQFKLALLAFMPFGSHVMKGHGELIEIERK